MNESWKPKWLYTSAKIIPFLIDINIIHFLSPNWTFLDLEGRRHTNFLEYWTLRTSVPIKNICTFVQIWWTLPIQNSITIKHFEIITTISILVMKTYFCTDVMCEMILEAHAMPCLQDARPLAEGIIRSRFNAPRSNGCYRPGTILCIFRVHGPCYRFEFN